MDEVWDILVEAFLHEPISERLVRCVTLVHRPLIIVLGGFSSSTSTRSRFQLSNPFEDQLINHYAVEIGEPGNATRYKLHVAKGSKIATLLVEPNATRGEYKVVKGVVITTDVLGKTSLSNNKLQDIADDLIANHGEYDLICNNCKRWATEMFNAACDVEGRFGAQVGEMFGKVLRAVGK